MSAASSSSSAGSDIASDSEKLFALKSWVPYGADCQFPIQNLPFGVFQAAATNHHPHIAVAIGDYAADLHVLQSHGVFEHAKHLPENGRCFKEPRLNDFMALGKPAWHEARVILLHLFEEKNATLRDNHSLRGQALIPLKDVEMVMPAKIGDYTDFYSSKNHAFNMGSILRGPANALQANWSHLPVGYHGRASSVVISGTKIKRPLGQVQLEEGKDPILSQSNLMDIELEMAFFFGGPANALGTRIPLSEASEHIFGVVLMNDWSARDVQKWEYVPLGPFTAKNFATTISPWIVTLEALEPFKIQLEEQNPKPLDYLYEADHFSYDVKLFVEMQGPEDSEASQVATSNLKYLYWTFRQQLVHHTVSGCNMQPGDLLATGTISGPDVEKEFGSLFEGSWRGTKEIVLHKASKKENSIRKFLKDGDTVIIKGECVHKSGVKIGFGVCQGTLLPATPFK